METNMRGETGRKGDWLQTWSGLKFFPLDPREEDVRVVDVAHALGNMCRFNGHCARFYSVGEHSCHVSDAIERWARERYSAPVACVFALYGLLHDGSEAYLVDVPRPLKVQPEMAAYRQAEAAVQGCVERALIPLHVRGLHPGVHSAVRDFDNDMLHLEAEQLMPRRPAAWSLSPIVHRFAVAGELGRMTPVEASTCFLHKHSRLIDAIGPIGAGA